MIAGMWTDTLPDRIEKARKYNKHPIFWREDINDLARTAYLRPEELYEINLSSAEIDALMMGLNIASDIL